MKVYLIGLSGSGKSTLGRKVASELSMSFVDLDHEIEKKEGKSISEIFSQHGEDYFRQIESALLREWTGSDKSFIMATGGGAPCFHQGIDVINQSGISIFFDVSIKELIKRLEKKADRPLLRATDMDGLTKKLETLRASRLSCYQQAKITVQDPTVEMVIKSLHIKK